MSQPAHVTAVLTAFDEAKDARDRLEAAVKKFDSAVLEAESVGYRVEPRRFPRDNRELTARETQQIKEIRIFSEVALDAEKRS